jgi:hypothetical protein
MKQTFLHRPQTFPGLRTKIKLISNKEHFSRPFLNKLYFHESIIFEIHLQALKIVIINH